MKPRKRPARKPARKAAKPRAETLESLVAHASAGFIDVSADEIDVRIRDTLERAARAVGGQRAYIVMFNTLGFALTKTHWWAETGIEPHARGFQRLGFDDCEWLMSYLKNELAVAVPRVGGLSATAAAEKRELLAQATRSAMFSPLVHGGAVVGFLGIEAVKVERPWKQADASRLEPLSRIVISALERKRTEQLIAEQQMKMVTASKMSALGEMAGGIAHEINNPLTIIHGKASQLRELLGDPKIDVAKALAAVERIETTSMRISRIVKGLRSFAREGENDPIQLVSVKAIVEDTLELCRERFQNHGVVLKVAEIEKDAQLECRSVEICQVLLNLLNNAFDAVEGMSEKWVQFSCTMRGATVEFSVTDAGHGIAAHVRERLFQPFFTTKGVGKGTGLGLSISKGIIESHQGTLRVDTRSSNTRFVISLPVSQDIPKKVRDEASILVVDDVKTMRVQIADLLKRFGFRHVLTAANGQQGRHALSNHKVNLVISDWRMGPVDGLEFLKFVRSEPRTSGIPFVMVTANDTRESVLQAIHAGVDEYLLKPLTLVQVQNRIFRLLMMRRAPV